MNIAHVLLRELGEDPTRPGLVDTPRRFADWWADFLEHEPGRLDTSFPMAGADEMVVVSGVRVWSLCEHHLLPFSCNLALGYIPAGRVLGLSKFGRLAHKVAHRLQVQERLVEELADELGRVTGSPDLAVIARGEHLCMSMRGVRTPAVMTTAVMRGKFKDWPATRAEFLKYAGI